MSFSNCLHAGNTDGKQDYRKSSLAPVSMGSWPTAKAVTPVPRESKVLPSPYGHLERLKCASMVPPVLTDIEAQDPQYIKPLEVVLDNLYKLRNDTHRRRMMLGEDNEDTGGSNISVRLKSSTVDQVGKEVDESPPLDVWLAMMRKVRLMHWIYSVLMARAKEFGLVNEKTLVEKYLVTVTVAAERMDRTTGEANLLSFNAKDFKAAKEVQIPSYVVKILHKAKDQRTSEDIEIVSQMMTSLPSFRKYTHQRQLSMSRIVRYLKCEKRRTVLRKGHMSYGIYFVYSGAVALRTDDNIFSKQDAIILRKGACFGEIGLIKNTRRNATLVTFEETEFLVVGKGDYLANGLDVLQQQEIETRFEFFRAWSPLYDLSDSAIRDLSNNSHTEEFGYNATVMADSRKSDMLFFVIKGQCDVQKLVEAEKVHADAIGSRASGQKRASKNASVDPASAKQLTAFCPQETCQVKPSRTSSVKQQASFVCVKVGELRPGDVYGVENMFQDSLTFEMPQGRFCLTSRGCTIIYFSSVKFKELTLYLNVDYTAMEMVMTKYPDDDEICSLISDQRRWDFYKRYTIEEMAVVQRTIVRMQNYMRHCEAKDARDGKLLEYKPPLKQVGVGPSAVGGLTHPFSCALDFLDIRSKLPVNRTPGRPSLKFGRALTLKEKAQQKGVMLSAAGQNIVRKSSADTEVSFLVGVTFI